jgi:neurotransmitter:Na+ symporter, NSS family
MLERRSIHGNWSSRWVFILAATGSAVGLGNIWKFPYMAGEYGGGAFVIVYILCVAMIGIPVMMAEIMIGRRGRQSPINAMHTLAREASRHHAWKLLGWSGVVAGFLILSFYSVIAGWALAYIPRMALLTGELNGNQAGEIFSALIADPERLLAWHTVFMVMTAVVIARGVEGGLERAVKFLMPALFLLLLVLVGYAMFATGKFQQGLSFLFNVDFHKLFYPACVSTTVACEFSGKGVLAAMGQAFFSLSIGMGAIMMYGAYLPKDTPITSTTIVIASADTLVAILAGLAIFPIVFAHGLAPGSGPGLVFVTLPIAFSQIPYGEFLGVLFFVLLVFAAWTSAISILEPAVAWLVETKGMNRVNAATWCSLGTWALGLLTILSFNRMSAPEFLNWAVFLKEEDRNFFGLIDYLTSNIMLPLGGLFIAIFAAWMMHRHTHHDELQVKNNGADISYQTWLFLIRYITPIGVLLIFLSAVGVFK